METITKQLTRYVKIFDSDATEEDVVDMLEKTNFLKFFEKVLEIDDDEELEELFDEWADPLVDLERPDYYNHAMSFAALVCLAGREPEALDIDDLAEDLAEDLVGDRANEDLAEDLASEIVTVDCVGDMINSDEEVLL